MDSHTEPMENDGPPHESLNMLVTGPQAHDQDSTQITQPATNDALPTGTATHVAEPRPEQTAEQEMMDVVEEAPLVAETSRPREGVDGLSQQVLDETTTIGATNLSAGEIDVSTAPAEPGSIAAANHAVLGTDGLIAKDFAAAAAQQANDPHAEWQLDSSDDDSDTTDSSDESDNDSDDEYALLDPATAARMLMAGDGDEDDAGEKKARGTGADHQPRTANEIKEDIIPRPDIEITPAMQITALGLIEGVIENNILIRGHTSGENQVLEPGSVLCNADRKVVGVVADLFGRVQQPMYSLMFNSAQEELAKELGLSTGAELFYVNDHSKFVFTKPLQSMKGTDASNIHDEEVGEDEMEFSDDEKEAEYKRQKKLAKKAGRGGMSRGAFNEGERIERPQSSGGRDSSTGYIRSSDAPSSTYGGGMNYDDDSNDGFYQPLRRPDNLSQMMMAPPGRRDDFMRGRGRGRGDRGRGRGDRGRGRGGQRGYSHQERDHAPQAQQSSSAPAYSAAQSYTAPPAPSQPQQTYQFNGFTFQYGAGQPQVTQYASQAQSTAPQYSTAPSASQYGQAMPAAPQYSQAPSAAPQYAVQAQYGQYPQATSAAPYAAPAYYTGYPQAGYTQPAYPQGAYSQQAAYPTQQYQQAAQSAAGYPQTQPPQPAAYGQGQQLTSEQQTNLAEVMKRLGAYPPTQ